MKSDEVIFGKDFLFDVIPQSKRHQLMLFPMFPVFWTNARAFGWLKRYVYRRRLHKIFVKIMFVKIIELSKHFVFIVVCLK